MQAWKRAGLGLVGLATVAATAGCEGMSAQEREIAGGLAGAAVGIVGADVLNAGGDWKILAALAGAAVGTMVARNEASGECAYARGDGTYRIAPCP